MREINRDGHTFVEVDGEQIPYDGIVKIYVDSQTGNWVVSTPYIAETVADLLADALEHFEDICEAGDTPSSIELGGVTVMPMPTSEWN